MKSITKLLKQYAKLTSPHESIRMATQKALKDLCGVDAPLHAITYRRGALKLDVSPAVRSSVLVKKEQLLEKLQKQFGGRVVDIR